VLLAVRAAEERHVVKGSEQHAAVEREQMHVRLQRVRARGGRLATRAGRGAKPCANRDE
jgi:hypothetical protein